MDKLRMIKIEFPFNITRLKEMEGRNNLINIIGGAYRGSSPLQRWRTKVYGLSLMIPDGILWAPGDFLVDRTGDYSADLVDLGMRKWLVSGLLVRLLASDLYHATELGGSFTQELQAMKGRSRYLER